MTRPRVYEEPRTRTSVRVQTSTLGRVQAEARRRLIGTDRVVQWALDDWLDAMEGQPVDAGT